MPDKILRGRVLRFLREPEGIDDAAVLRLRRGRRDPGPRRAASPPSAPPPTCWRRPPGREVVDHRPHLLMPGFIDTHIHMPQAQVIASWGAQLLDWLNTYTFPEESKFSDPAHAARIAGAFLDELLAPRHHHGRRLLLVAPGLGRRLLRRGRGARPADDRRQGDDGPQLPRTACATPPQSSYDDSKALIARWHGQGRALYAISPRFAITSTPAQMEMAQALVAEHPDLHMQTHLSENRDEIDFTLSLYPEARDYLDVYETLRPARAEEPVRPRDPPLRPRDRGDGRDRLGRGLLPDLEPLPRLRASTTRSACARRASAAPSPPTSAAAPTTRCCAPSTRATRCWRCAARSSTRSTAFWWITRGNAEALGARGPDRHARAGHRGRHRRARQRAPPRRWRCARETVETLAEELFLLETLGDDRAVAATYVAGRALGRRRRVSVRSAMAPLSACTAREIVCNILIMLYISVRI